MKPFLLFFVFFLVGTLYGKNPKIYAALGDKIYNSEGAIEKLLEIKEYESFHDSIEKYLRALKRARELGLKIEKGESHANRMYLSRLRELAKKNDFYHRSASYLFKRSMQEKNYPLFVALANTGLIDLEKEKELILSFYRLNKEKIRLSGKLKAFVEKYTVKKKVKHSAEYYRRLKKMQEEEKIRRLREKDRKEQEALQRRLDEKLKLEKRKIEEEQLKKLKESL